MTRPELEEKLKHFLVDISDFDIQQQIGKGGFGEVFYGIHNLTGRKVAIKKLYLEKLEGKMFVCYIWEVEVLVSYNKQFLIPFIGYSNSTPYIIVTEYVPSGSLFQALRHKSGSPFLNGARKTLIALGIIHGMISLHDQNIIHRDLKSLNILLVENTLPKICDFRVAPKPEYAAPNDHPTIDYSKGINSINYNDSDIKPINEEETNQPALPLPPRQSSLSLQTPDLHSELLNLPFIYKQIRSTSSGSQLSSDEKNINPFLTPEKVNENGDKMPCILTTYDASPDFHHIDTPYDIGEKSSLEGEIPNQNFYSSPDFQQHNTSIDNSYEFELFNDFESNLKNAKIHDGMQSYIKNLPLIISNFSVDSTYHLYSSYVLMTKGNFS